jgi:hypothetical protein
VSGGLKLKGGAKDAGVKKKSKKSKTSKDKTSKPQEATTAAAAEPESTKPSDTTLALSNPPSDHDRDLIPSASTGTGKTEAQRRHEEIKRKRVSLQTTPTNSKSAAQSHRRHYTRILTPSSSTTG